MNSPFPGSTSRAGDGCIVVRLLPAGGSGLETLVYQYPLKLISPSPTVDQKSALIFLLSYGGGLVAGDRVRLSITVRCGAALSLVTQGHTKIFKSPSPQVVTSQELRVQVDDGASLCLLPDPVQPFEGSVYDQVQIFKLGNQSSLCFLDWVTQGRVARGENWNFIKWTGRNEVWLKETGEIPNGRLLVRDTVILSEDQSKSVGLDLRGSMQKMGIFGTLILRGPVVAQIGEFFMTEFAALPRLGSRDFRSSEVQQQEGQDMSELEHWRSQRVAAEKGQGVLWSAARIRGCVIVKLGAPTVEAAREWIAAMLTREGTVEAHFGHSALMCVR